MNTVSIIDPLTIVVVAVVALAVALVIVSLVIHRNSGAAFERVLSLFEELTRQNISWAQGEQERYAIERDVEKLNLGRDRAEQRLAQRTPYSDTGDRTPPPGGGFDLETDGGTEPLRI